MILLHASHVVLILAAVSGVVHLVTTRPVFRKAMKALAALFLLVQFGFLIQLAVTIPKCILLHPWGVLSVMIMFGVSISWWMTRREGSPRIVTAVLALFAVTAGMAHLLVPESEGVFTPLGWELAFHIFFVTLGTSVLGLGFIAGILVFLRGRELKHSGWAKKDEVVWPSLTSLDRLFIRSLGAGVAMLAVGMVLGALSVSAAEGAVWFRDPRILLTLVACVLYAAVWALRKKQGFSTKPVVALATIGFALIMIGFLLSGIAGMGVHKF